MIERIYKLYNKKLYKDPCTIICLVGRHLRFNYFVVTKDYDLQKMIKFLSEINNICEPY